MQIAIHDKDRKISIIIIVTMFMYFLNLYFHLFFPGELNGTEDSLLPLDMNLCTPAAPSRATPGAADSADCTPVTSGYVRATPAASYSAANCSVEMGIC